MKQKSFKIFTIILCILLLTGCTKTLKDDQNKPIKNEETGQILTENIICQPTETETIKTYEENNVNIKDLPTCKNFKIVVFDRFASWDYGSKFLTIFDYFFFIHG